MNVTSSSPRSLPRVCVVEFAGKGGLIHYAFQLCRAISDAGADVTLVTDRNYELHSLPHSFRVVELFALWDPKPVGESRVSPMAALGRRLRRLGRAVMYYRAWLQLRRYLRDERPDVVLFGDVRFAADLACLRLVRRLDIPMVDICHNVLPFRANRRSGDVVHASRLTRLAFSAVYRSFDRVLVHYERNRAAFLAAYGVDPARVGTIRHGNEALFEELRDPASSAERLRADLGLSPGAKVVLSFGTLTRYKGIDTTLEAFPRVLAGHPSARLVIAGPPGPDFDLAAHRRLACELGIEQAVLFVPRYIDSDAVASWIELASVGVLGHRAVFQSGVLHLFQTFGVPLVVTRAGAAEEVIQDGESGVLVPVGDSAQLGRAIADLLDDPERAVRLGRQAERDARTTFGWGEIARELLGQVAGIAERS